MIGSENGPHPVSYVHRGSPPSVPENAQTRPVPVMVYPARTRSARSTPCPDLLRAFVDPTPLIVESLQRTILPEQVRARTIVRQSCPRLSQVVGSEVVCLDSRIAWAQVPGGSRGRHGRPGREQSRYDGVDLRRNVGRLCDGGRAEGTC